MTTLATLPDLVILNILKYLQLPRSHIILDTEYCAISSKWRQLALPISYSKIYFQWNYFGNGRSNFDYWESNIDRYTTRGLKELVKKIEIEIFETELDFALLLGPLLNRINQGTFDWPREYGLLLAGEIRNGQGMDRTYVHQSLDGELLEKMKHVLERFASKFPNVIGFLLYLQTARGTARQFTNQLIDVFSPRIKELNMYLEFPLDIEYYPPKLKCLKFRLSPNSKYPLPKIRNSKELEVWEMKETFNNISWLDLVDVPADSQPIVFSNLKSLTLDFLKYADYELSGRVAPAPVVQPHFPRLANLNLFSENMEDRLLFNPKLIAPSLEKMRSDVSLQSLALFRKLPIHFIGKLDAILDLCKIKDMDELYLSTNRLLKKLTTLGKAHVLFLMRDLTKWI